MFYNIKNRLDCPIIRQILATAVYENSLATADSKIEEYRNRHNWSLYGWIENGKIVGVCGFKVRHDEQVKILHIAVTENARGRGIGKAMVNALLNLFCLPIKAETDDDAVGFYRKLGFETSKLNIHGVHRWACILGAPHIPKSIEGLEPSKVVISYMPKITKNQLWDFYFRNQICEAGYGKEAAVESLKNERDFAVAAFYEDYLVGFIRVCSCGDIKEACLELALQGDNLENNNGSLIEKDTYGIFKQMGLMLIDNLTKQGIDFVSMTIVENLEEPAFASIGMEHNKGYKVFVKDMRMYV